MKLKWWKVDELPEPEMCLIDDRKYCLISKNGYYTGEHYLTTKVLNVKDKCRIEAWIGIIPIRESKWIKQGIKTNWPNVVDCVCYSGGWNYNDTIQIKMDIARRYVAFWKNNQLIEARKIPFRTQWYFMITGAIEMIKRIECTVVSHERTVPL